MTTTTLSLELASLEDRLEDAELGPDAAFYEEFVDDPALMIAANDISFSKSHILDAHRPGKGNNFTRVEMSDMKIIEHGTAAVVTGKGLYEGANGTHNLKFMRVWVSKPEGWRIVAGSVS